MCANLVFDMYVSQLLLLLSRLAYPVWILNDLFDGMVDSSGLTVHMLYDVACLLESHLQVCSLFLKIAVVK